jgi:hypothetical protein
MPSVLADAARPPKRPNQLSRIGRLAPHLWHPMQLTHSLRAVERAIAADAAPGASCRADTAQWPLRYAADSVTLGAGYDSLQTRGQDGVERLVRALPCNSR